MVISYLGTLIKRQAEAARLQERQTAAMHALSRELAGTRGVENILQVSVKHFSEIFQCEVVALLPDENGKLHLAAGDLASVFHQDIVKELGVAQGAYDAGQMAGWGTQTLPDSPILSVPLQAADATLGVLALRPRDPAIRMLAAAGTIAPPPSGIPGQASRPGLAKWSACKRPPWKLKW